MKLAIAIIRRPRVKAVVDSLLEAGIKGVTVSEVRGYGEQKGGYRAYTIPHSKLEVVIEDEQINEVCEIIIAGAQTGEAGDGIIVLQPVYEMIRIRTGRTGPKAL